MLVEHDFEGCTGVRVAPLIERVGERVGAVDDPRQAAEGSPAFALDRHDLLDDAIPLRLEHRPESFEVALGFFEVEPTQSIRLEALEPGPIESFEEVLRAAPQAGSLDLEDQPRQESEPRPRAGCFGVLGLTVLQHPSVEVRVPGHHAPVEVIERQALADHRRAQVRSRVLKLEPRTAFGQESSTALIGFECRGREFEQVESALRDDDVGVQIEDRHGLAQPVVERGEDLERRVERGCRPRVALDHGPPESELQDASGRA